MTGFDIALSLFVIAGLLFYGRCMHNKEQEDDVVTFKKELRRRSQLRHGERVEARRRDNPFG